MRRQLAGFAAIGALSVAVLAAPASSAPTQVTGLASYTADAAARALDLELAGTRLIAGDTTAHVDSTPTAAGHGTGALLDPALVGDATAASPTGGTNVVVPETCSPLVISDPNLPLSAATACGEATAETEGDPSSSGAGHVEEIAIQIEGTPFDEPLTQILGPTGAGQLLTALEPVTGPLADAGIDASSLLSDVLAQLVGGTPAASVTLGEAVSNTTVTADAVTSTATAAGGVISLLGLVDVAVGPSSATVSVNRATGVITHSEQAAAISVTLHAGVLGLLPDQIEGPLFDGLGAPLEGTSRTVELLTAEQLAALQESGLFDANGCLNPQGSLPAPLNTLVCVQVAATSYTEDVEGPDISATGAATAVNLRLLDGIVPDGGVQVALSAASATVTAVLAVQVATTAAPTTAPPTLARTGGSDFSPALVVGIGGLALAAAVLARRAAAAR